MNLQEFARDIVPILQLLVGLAGLASLLLLWRQMRQTHLWNKLQSGHNFIKLESMKLEQALIEQAAKIGVHLKGRANPLSEIEVNQLLENSDCYFALLTFLNDVEGICAAIAIGFADPDLSYANHSSRVIGTYRLYEPVIRNLRARDKDEELLIELQKLALIWERRYLKQMEQQKTKIEQLEKMLKITKGLEPKV